MQTQNMFLRATNQFIQMKDYTHEYEYDETCADDCDAYDSAYTKYYGD
jgi:hypothetical protein